MARTQFEWKEELIIETQRYGKEEEEESGRKLGGEERKWSAPIKQRKEIDFGKRCGVKEKWKVETEGKIEKQMHLEGTSWGRGMRGLD